MRGELEARGHVAETKRNADSAEIQKSNHSYYQGLLLVLGKMKGFGCWAPNQDRNKRFLDVPLESLRTVQTIPSFSYEHLVKRSETIDVIWFNQRKMPDSFFEVEHSTDIQNSLLKFNDLQDFNSRMIVVANAQRKPEFEKKLRYASFQHIEKRVKFLPYDWLVKEYEHTIEASQQETRL